jgi:hypothetical protein
MAEMERHAHPTADRFVAVVPKNWFAVNTIGPRLPTAGGVSYPTVPDLVMAEARRGLTPNGVGPAIVAHEIGHSYDLRRLCEEYDLLCNGTPDIIGNYAAPGLWVDKRILIQIPTSRPVYCFMSSTDAFEYWIDAHDYSILLNSQKVGSTSASIPSMATPQAILVSGIFDSGAVALDNWYILPEAALSTLFPGPYAFEYQNATGAVLHQESFDISYTFAGVTLTQAPFVFTIPYIPGTAKIIVKHNGIALAQKIVSPHAPKVTLIEPNGGERLSGQTTIRWSGSDTDGDPLSYVILFSPDNGLTWEPIAIDLTITSYVWDIPQLPAGNNYRIKLIVTDGINTGQDTSDAPFTIQEVIHLPLIIK